MLNFRAQLFNKVNKSLLKLISMMILALCKVEKVNHRSLANIFNCHTNAESPMRKIQRFMADFDLPMKLISCFIFGLLPKKKNFFLVLDRTNWKFGNSNINILMPGICYKNSYSYHVQKTKFRHVGKN